MRLEVLISGMQPLISLSKAANTTAVGVCWANRKIKMLSARVSWCAVSTMVRSSEDLVNPKSESSIKSTELLEVEREGVWVDSKLLHLNLESISLSMHVPKIE